jgi:hypothetical protein
MQRLLRQTTSPLSSLDSAGADVGLARAATLSQLAQRLLVLVAAGAMLGGGGLAKAANLRAPEAISAEAPIAFANGASDPRSAPAASEHSIRDSGALPDLDSPESEITIKEPRGSGIASPSAAEIRRGEVPPAFVATGPAPVLIPGALVVVRF